jgi:arachidonate 15-lipoxygenase
MSIDMKSQPTVQVTGVVRAPIDKVWAVFRPFSDLMKWWTIYEWVKLEAPGKDDVGAVRQFHTKTNRTYREKLVERDDSRHFERYDFIDVEPSVPTLSGITSTVEMKDLGGGQTQVVWCSWTDASSLVMGQIKSVQEETYRNAIADLDHFFNPALGKLQVTVVSGTGLDDGSFWRPEPYVVVQLDDGPVQRTRAKLFTETPVFNDTLTFQVLSPKGTLRVSAWDANIGRDTMLGGAEIDLHTLKSGQRTTQTLDLRGGRGGKLTIELLLQLDKGEALPLTEEEQKLSHLAALEGVFAKLSAQAMQLAQQAAQGPQPRYGYARYKRSPELPEVPLENLPRMVAGLPPDQALSPNKLSRMVERGVEYAYSQAQFLNRVQESGADPFRAYFGGWVKAPEHVVAHWQDDAELARQFIQGVGPLVIRVVTDLQQVPEAMRGLAPGGRGLQELIADKSLFLLDYEALASLKLYRNMFFYAPYALVYKEKLPGGDSRLNLAAIQLTRNAAGNKIYTPGGQTPNRWLFAKMHLACADNQYHQWLFHLGYAHLAMEPFAIAWHDALPKDHPISILLAPHFHDTIGINFLARQTLVSDIAPFTDQTFSTGTAQALQMFLGAWQKYDFFKQSFPEQLLARGFDEQKSDGLQDYHFRDDGFLIWNAIGEYARGVVDAAYADDAAVAADKALQTWAEESTDPNRAAIPGFPKAFTTKELLARTLQTLIWAVSAQHSAVNFSQFEFLAYVPNRPDSLFRPMPDGDADIDMKDIQSALPSTLISHFQISFAWLLTLPTELPLTAVDAVAKLYPSVHEAFKKRLQDVSAQIRARNERLVAQGKDPYPYLLPENIASSIAI